MKKILIGMAGGILLLSTVFLWPLNSSFASSGPEGTEDIQIIGIEDLDIGILVSALKKAESEIEDEELKTYYRVLIEKYDLEAAEESENDDTPYVEILPDIDQIVRAAIVTPSEEAGKTITDPEIKDFYYDFLEDVGWEFD